MHCPGEPLQSIGPVHACYQMRLTERTGLGYVNRPVGLVLGPNNWQEWTVMHALEIKIHLFSHYLLQWYWAWVFLWDAEEILQDRMVLNPTRSLSLMGWKTLQGWVFSLGVENSTRIEWMSLALSLRKLVVLYWILDQYCLISSKISMCRPLLTSCRHSSIWSLSLE